MNRRRRLIRGGAWGGPSTQLTLDLITTQPAAAYGFRKLRAAYNGSCLRIRRSSDNAEQDIGFVGTDLDTAAIATFIGGGSGFIRTWYDQSTNANNLGNAMTTAQPTYGSSQMTFDGTSDVLAFDSSITHTSGYTVFTNLKANDTATTKTILCSNSVAGALQLRLGTTELFTIVRVGQAVLATGATPTTTKTVTRWKSGSAGNSVFINGVSDVSNATNAALTQPVSIVGNTAALGADWFNGDMQEIIIYTADLGNTDSNTIGSNMATFAGTSWTNI